MVTLAAFMSRLLACGLTALEEHSSTQRRIDRGRQVHSKLHVKIQELRHATYAGIQIFVFPHRSQ